MIDLERVIERRVKLVRLANPAKQLVGEGLPVFI